MFRYIITPANETRSLVLAFTIKDETITGYATTKGRLESLPLIGSFFSSSYASTTSAEYFRFCMKEYKDSGEAMFWRQNYPGHDAMHSEEIGETNVPHYHFRHSKKITTDLLKKFFSSLKKCEEIKKLTDGEIAGETFFTHAVRKDIIKKYHEYEKANTKTVYTTSNNLDYLKKMPTLEQHTCCLSYPDSSGCLPDNPITEACDPSLATNSNDGYFTLANSLFAIKTGFYAFTLYKTVHRFFNRNAQERAPTVEPTQNPNMRNTM